MKSNLVKRSIWLPLLAVMTATGGALATHFLPENAATQQAWGRPTGGTECVEGQVEATCTTTTSNPACTFEYEEEEITAHNSSTNCASNATLLKRP